MQTHTCTHAHTVSFTEFFVQLYASKHKNGGIAWLYLYILFPLCIVLSSHFHQLFHACSFSACWFRYLARQNTLRLGKGDNNMPNGHNYMSNLLHTPMHRLVISYLTLSMLYWNFEGNWAGR